MYCLVGCNKDTTVPVPMRYEWELVAGSGTKLDAFCTWSTSIVIPPQAWAGP